MSTMELENRYMEFRLGEQIYAIPLLAVKEVIQRPDITSVPNMPNHFEGMMNLRGQILGVFSIRKRLGAKPRESSEENKEVVVIIEDRDVAVGMIVDEVTRVIHVTPEMVRPAPLKQNDPARAYINMVIQIEGELVLTLDVFQLLEMEKIKNQENAA